MFYSAPLLENGESDYYQAHTFQKDDFRNIYNVVQDFKGEFLESRPESFSIHPRQYYPSQSYSSHPYEGSGSLKNSELSPINPEMKGNFKDSKGVDLEYYKGNVTNFCSST